ncbi:type VI secretion IcmF C-terminal domain-containing protein [Corallococcus sp. EGB]|uniref:type VI secretion IcmF C-terminal domain-containing protein n=1 Tax=Corallococcus sp. EGB TaxID=1521117 RepID=UPI001CC15325|nr:type VI secretion IcmF C-terminal domain-containing protein [Corallococcus sp. EGB]
MGALQSILAALQAHWVLVLGIGVVLAAIGVGVALWWRRRKGGGPALTGGQKPLASGQLLAIRKKFLAKLPWRFRASVRDFPTLVVMGPAGNGKSDLIKSEVDWERQQRQFMPSHTDDPLLNIFLGPEVVVQELASPVLEDDSLHARRALRRLWKATFGRRHVGRAVIVLQAKWLLETSPDEQKRVTQLLRGKVNLLSEVCQAPVETRLVLTRMDALEGYADFAELLRKHGVPLELEVPPPGREGELADALHPMEKYLALGLTSLTQDAFERLANFYSRGGDAFAALGRFVSTLMEGGSLTYPLRLQRVYLSAGGPKAEPTGALAVHADQPAALLARDYRWTHLRRCAVILAVGCLPVLLAYAHFYQLILRTRDKLDAFQVTVQRLEERNQSVSGSVVESQTNDAVRAMEDLWHATRFWPPLAHSFTDEREELRARLARSIRMSYLKPMLERCQAQCRRCPGQIPGCQPAPVFTGRATRAAPLTPAPAVDDSCHLETLCRPEQTLYTLGVLYSSRNEDLGQFVLRSVHGAYRKQLSWTAEAYGLSLAGAEPEKNWLDAMGLADPMVANYVIASDKPFDEDVPWTRWPYAYLTMDGLLGPWREHFMRLQDVLGAKELELARWAALADERERLRTSLAESAPYNSARKVMDLINASDAEPDASQLKGVGHLLDSLDWLRQNRQTLEAILRMEDEADAALRAAARMTPAELLTRADGLFAPSDGDARYQVEVLRRDFEFRPMDVSRQLLDKVLRTLKETGRTPFNADSFNPRTGETTSEVANEGVGDDDTEFASGQAPVVGRVLGKAAFDAQLAPLVDEFTTRLAKSSLSREEAVERATFVQGKVQDFAKRYGKDLFATYRGYRFRTTPRGSLASDLSVLLQPSSPLEAMLRDVASRAGVGPLESEYYAPMRDAVAPFKPVVQLMQPDKNGAFAELAAYTTLVSQLQQELSGVKPAAAPKDAAAPGAAGATASSAGSQLAEMLSPVGRVALSMLLEEEDSYLRRVDAWLDQHGLVGEFRAPFRQPFIVVRNRGRAELERVIAEQWAYQARRTLDPLVKRYPFNPSASQEVDPVELEVLRRKDGAFWAFVTQVLSPVVEERGADWSLRYPLKSRLLLPPRMLTSLGQLGRLSKLLWDDEGKARPIAMQVRPLPLPTAPTPDSFVTLSYLKCGGAASFGFNQRPAWGDFPLNWWSPQPSSIGVELRSPSKDGKRYRSMEMSESSWNCFRLLESATLTDQSNVVWVLPGRGLAANEKVLEISFGLRGEPWAPFRGVVP